jgi:hypothetical protein
MPPQKQQVYHSYLLRLWRKNNSSQARWRASLESAQTGKTYHFASIEALFAFLSRQAGSADNQDEKDQSF